VRGLVRRLRSRTLVLVVTAVEVALGGLLLWGAFYWERLDFEYLAVVLTLKAAGYFLIAALTTRDLLPRRGTNLVETAPVAA